MFLETKQGGGGAVVQELSLRLKPMDINLDYSVLEAYKDLKERVDLFLAREVAGAGRGVGGVNVKHFENLLSVTVYQLLLRF